eukprot:SAG31_NODE_2419_length_5727_cov_4.235963_4_plen_262_part_00
MPGRLHPRVFNISPDSKVWEVFNAQKTHGFGQDVHYHPTGPGGEANLFCCDGWLMFGPPSKLWQPILTAHLVAVPVGLFCVYEGQYMPDWGIEEFKLSVLLPVVFMCISLISLFLTATKDPGVTLRSQDPAIVSQRASATGNDPQSTTTVSMDGFEVNLKHCRTCKVWRSPRSTHCDACDNCVEGFDHHCPWVGTCIGADHFWQNQGQLVAPMQAVENYTCGADDRACVLYEQANATTSNFAGLYFPPPSYSFTASDTLYI